MMGVPNNEPGKSGACPQGGDRLTAMVDGQLSPDEVVALEAHLENCATCQAELQDVRLAVAAVGSLAAGAEPLTAPPELMQRFQAGLQALADRPPGPDGAVAADGRGRRRLRGRLIMLGAGIASMAACVLLMLELGTPLTGDGRLLTPEGAVAMDKAPPSEARRETAPEVVVGLATSKEAAYTRGALEKESGEPEAVGAAGKQGGRADAKGHPARTPAAAEPDLAKAAEPADSLEDTRTGFADGLRERVRRQMEDDLESENVREASKSALVLTAVERHLGSGVEEFGAEVAPELVELELQEADEEDAPRLDRLQLVLDAIQEDSRPEESLWFGLFDDGRLEKVEHESEELARDDRYSYIGGTRSYVVSMTRTELERLQMAVEQSGLRWKRLDEETVTAALGAQTHLGHGDLEFGIAPAAGGGRGAASSEGALGQPSGDLADRDEGEDAGDARNGAMAPGAPAPTRQIPVGRPSPDPGGGQPSYEIAGGELELVSLGRALALYDSLLDLPTEAPGQGLVKVVLILRSDPEAGGR